MRPAPAADPRPEDNGSNDNPDGPWCAQHPGGTDAPCRPCGAARVSHEAAQARADLERHQRAHAQAEARRAAFLGEIRDVCDHGTPAGDQINPTTGAPWCPLCRTAALEV